MAPLLPFLAKFLHVRRSELDRTLQVAGFAMVLGWAMYTAFNAAQAIFLTKSGPQAYPLFFIILALAVWPMVALQGALTRRIGVTRAFRVNLALNVVAAIGVFIAYEVDESPAVAFTAYVIYSVAFELVMLQFWLFVTQHFNLLEGKRIFPVIAAGSSIGYILSGVTTTAIAIFATEPLIFVWAIGSAVSIYLISWLEKRLYRPAFDDDAEQFFAEEHVARSRHGFATAVRAAVQYLTGSRLVLALILLALVLQVASRVGDYLVAVIFVNATHNDLQALTILLGNAWLASYVVQLVVSLVIAPIALEKLGVKNSILALPVFTLVGFTLMAVSPVLVTSLFLFIVRNGLQTGLDDPAENVLGSALPAQIGPELTASEDAMLRRLAFQMAPPEVISPDQLGAAAFDPDPWVRAAAAVAGASRRPPWEGSTAVFDRLVDANDVQHRAAAVWAASFVGDHKMVAAALVDPEPRVRLEGLRSFAKMKANVPGSASGLIACMRDPERDVKRAALREATRWSPPPELEADFVAALVDGLASADREVRRPAAEALAAQPPAALAQALPLLEGRGDSAPATIEALVRSGRPELFERARGHLEHRMTEGVHLARLGARRAASHHRGEDGSAGPAFRPGALA